MTSAILDNPALLGPAEGAPALRAQGRMTLAYGLFLLLTATVFLRPAEIFVAIQGWPIYEIIIGLCVLTAAPKLINQLRWTRLKTRPWELCVAGILLAIVLADLSHGDTYGARTAGIEFAKVLVYYRLLLALVDTRARFRHFLAAVAIFVAVLAALAVLNYHEVIDIPALEAMQEHSSDDPVTGDPIYIVRLMATGVFHDPNDFSLVLAAALIICLHGVIEVRQWLKKTFWCGAIVVLLYAFTLTRSRGGFLALMAGGALLAAYRFGWRRAALLAIPVLPVVLFFGGRQVAIDINDENDTGQARIQLWRDSLNLFKTAPAFGIGVGQLEESNGLVAHNSYVHAFSELGLFGGTLYVAAWFLPMIALWRIRKDDRLAIREATQVGWSPYVLAMTLSYVVGMYSLSRCYALPTYLAVGIVAAHLNVLYSAVPDAAGLRVGRRLTALVAMLGMSAIVLLFLFVRIFAQ